MPLLANNSSTQQCRWHSYSTAAELEQAATQAILCAAQQAISQRGAFHIVLAGGTTPRRIYESMRETNANWAAWHVYFGDERCLPPDNVERNSRMAAQAWLDHVPIPANQIHFIPAEMGAQNAASIYAQKLAGIELFDLVLLGLGEDGHTASLFPDHYWGNTPDAPAAIAIFDSPKPPPQRVSLSAHRLAAAYQVIFLVAGIAKQQAINNWRNGVSIPAASIAPTSGVDVYIESALLKGQTGAG